MMDEKPYYRYSYNFGDNDIEVHEMDYYDNEILNETNVGVDNAGVYHFFMYSDSKDNVEMFLSQISHVLYTRLIRIQIRESFILISLHLPAK